MIDIFSDEVKPKIYVADITIECRIPTRSKKAKQYDIFIYKLHKQPITLLLGEIVSKKKEKVLFDKIYKEFIHRGDYDKIIFKITSIENVEYLSEISYKFNPLIH